MKAVFRLLCPAVIAVPDFLSNIPAKTETSKSMVQLNKWWRQGAEKNRFLSSDSYACTELYLTVFPPEEYYDFYLCRQDEYEKQYDRHGTAGSTDLVDLDCWCKHNVSAGLDRLGCCGLNSVAGWCIFNSTHGCQPDCTTPEALECMDKCNPRCFEDGQHDSYYPEGCEYCEECALYFRCILESSNEPVCHKSKFWSGEQIETYTNCMQKYSLQNLWLHHNADSHCLCQAGISGLAEDTGCCHLPSSDRNLCENVCRTQEECQSGEAVACHNDCGLEHCGSYDWDEKDDICNTKCVGHDAPCASWSSCLPQVRPVFDYICDDDTQPLQSGCCRSATTGDHCPSLCLNGTTPHKFGIGTGYQYECECNGCPSNRVEKQANVEEINGPAIQQYIQEQIISASLGAGIDSPSSAMYALADQYRNNFLELLVNDSTRDELDAAKESFSRQLAVLATRAAENRVREQQLGSNSVDNIITIDRSAYDDSDQGIPWYVVVLMLALVLAVLVIVVREFQRRKKSTDFHNMNPPGLVSRGQPSFNSSEIVMGNPVGSGDFSGTFTSTGTPVPGGKTEKIDVKPESAKSSSYKV